MTGSEPSGEPTWQGRQFPDTRWSIVARAQQSAVEVRQKALADLCRIYWHPVYAFARAKGNSPHDAEDLTQGFFARLLERDDFVKVASDKGKLRSFLAASMKNYMINEGKKARRQKRGGGQVPISIDQTEAEERYNVSLAETLTPEKVFERHWASALLARVMEALGNKYEQDGKRELFDALKVFLSPKTAETRYAEVARELGMSESAIRVAVHRLRQRYGKLLRETIADTLSEDEDPEEELRYLFGVSA